MHPTKEPKQIVNEPVHKPLKKYEYNISMILMGGCDGV